MSLLENGTGLSAADVAAVTGNGNGRSMFGGDGLFWIIVLFLFAFMGGWGNGNNGGGQVNYGVQDGFNQQALMTGLNGITATLNANQLANTQKSLNEAVKARDTYKDKYANATKGPARPETPSRAAQLSKNNAVGNGNGGYVAQGGHVQINGGKSNVTFTLAAPSTGVLNSANKQASSVGGTLLHCVTTSSPGVSFKSAVVNFTVTGVTANDTIAVYQLQGNTWVQVLVSSITDNHVTVNLTQHGPLAFVRVAAVATATH